VKSDAERVRLELAAELVTAEDEKEIANACDSKQKFSA